MQPEMIPVPAATRQPARWQTLWREAVRDPAELLRRLGLEGLSARVSASAQGAFPLRVPAGYLARMRHGDPHDPLLRQVLPLDLEDRLVPGFTLDAVGDAQAKAGTGVIHKYEGRALLIATGSCAIHCRYCFRRHFPYAEETAAAGGWASALEHLRADPSVREVILSGGDPLSLSTAKLAELTDALRGLPQITRLRIHTRLPIVLPERIDAEFLDWIGALPWPVVMVVHANHAREINEGVRTACAALRERDVHLLNQAVLLRGVNDDVDALVDLSEALFGIGVLPYYLHQLDRVQGAAHFEVPESEGAALHRALHARLPGYLLPRRVREDAGQPGKTLL
ncbi:EF-P beta-lysylation protein EpmB [Silanimonas sp.]|uniref:EF-P beta-lysylation protein EpmB n=1 Tax=Silanimonas sp. TaxID=1929290 RepID=UPI001BC386A0|nr:EF-P beta-lysylation protein EpmB [Silanimonas sp.]MBS3896641.1 EF-P beta-lysylation protein EpmB [Silanimonas sp.]MBS3924692.1 EF-P beta-lysylation protein EpmB [Xanthomonadaceae bacterium]